LHSPNVCGRIPHLDRIRFVNTGTEAVLFAIKAARAFTGRAKIAKIEGAYHGAYDWVEVSQAATPENCGDASAPASAPFYRGMPKSATRWSCSASMTQTVPVGSYRRTAMSFRRSCWIRCGAAAGLMKPTPEFISAVQEAARTNDILINADEVLNPRQGFARASARYGIRPDLIAMGKIIGGWSPHRCPSAVGANL
jgi:glutamate-1-semialdehyde 2,1-aminomutase